MKTTLFAYLDEHASPPTAATREREVEAYYAKHANATANVVVLKWVIAALLLFVWFAAWADDNDHADQLDTRTVLLAVLPVNGAAEREAVEFDKSGSLTTLFIDGPTGFVFVYTADGWKFVPGAHSNK